MRGILVALFAIVAVVSGIIALLGRLFVRREDIDWKDAPKPGNVIEVDGEPIHYIDEGSGPGVVLIHGFGGNTYSFRYLLPDLAHRHRVIAVDLLGFGYSGRTEGADYSNQAQAERVVKLMDLIGLRTASIIGHSMGGGVAMRIAASWPEKVERLVLAGSISGDTFRRRLPVLPVKPVNQLLASFVGWVTFRRSFYDVTNATDEIRENYRRPFRIRGSYEAIMSVVRDTANDPPIQFDKITAPVLLLFARAERIVPGWMRRRLEQKFPSAQVVTIDRAGHLLLEEQPEECNAVIRSFLPVGDSAVSATAETQAVDVSALSS
jgi:pimeloyl-ACP methyl ester carboxylesterase